MSARFHSNEAILSGADTMCALINARTSAVKFGSPVINYSTGICTLYLTVETKTDFKQVKLEFKTEDTLFAYLDGAIQVAREELQ